MRQVLCASLVLGASVFPGVAKAAPPPLIVRGTVTDVETGAPVANARILVTPELHRLDQESIGHTRSRADGSFHHEAPPYCGPERLFVTVIAPGYAFWRGERAFRGTGIWVHRVELARGVPVRGQVRLADGKPASRGWVGVRQLHQNGWLMGNGIPREPRWVRKRGRTSATTRSIIVFPLGEDGAFEVAVRAERVRFFAVAPGRLLHIETHELETLSESTKPLRFTLEGGPRLPVHAVDQQGVRLGGVRVDQRIHTGRVSGHTYSTPINPASELEEPFQVFARPRMLLELSHPEFVTKFAHLDAPTDTALAKIMLRRATWLEIHLEDDRGPRADLTAIDLDYDAQDEGRRETWHTTLVWDTTLGAFRSGPMDPKTCLGMGRLHVPGTLPRKLQWEARPGAQKLEAVRLVRARTLEVMVVDSDGRPVRDAEVLVRPRSGGELVQPDIAPFTDTEGRVAVGGIGEPAVRVEVRAPMFRPDSRHVKLRKASTRLRVVLRPRPGR